MITEETAATAEVIERFNTAFNRHDVDRVMELMTDDVVFENTGPAPDGTRHVGQDDVRQFWEQFFADSPNALFEVEDQFIAGDRCAIAWRYTWRPAGAAGEDPGYVRGVDLFRVRDGKVAEKFSYVKG